VPIIRRNNYIYAKLSGMHPAYQIVLYAGCIPCNHPYRVTSTKCRIDTVISPEDGHIVARNVWRKEINILRKLCTKLALFTRLYRDARSTKHKILHMSLLRDKQAINSCL